MSTLNKAQIIGRLGADPDTRYMPNGKAVTNIRVATSETWKDKDSGDRKEKTEWHSIVFFDKLAEIAGQYLKKGALVYVEGKIQTRKWQDKEGKGRYTTEIVAAQMQMLGGKPQGERVEHQASRHDATNSANPPTDGFEDDIPF